MRENDMSDIIKRLEFVFCDEEYRNRVDKSDKRWLDADIDEVFNGILEYLNNFPHFPHTNSKADIQQKRVEKHSD